MVDGTSVREDDDWRLEVDVSGSEPDDWLAAVVASQALARDISLAFEDRVIASRDETRVFFYAASREQCEATRMAVEAEARERGWRARTSLMHWHPYSEEWQPSDVSMPSDATAISDEKVELQRREQQETATRGYPEFEVRVDLPSHHDARTLWKALKEEELLPVRRWKYVLIGVTDEVTGEELAQRISASFPGCNATVEGTTSAVRDDVRMTERKPFSMLGFEESSAPEVTESSIEASS